MNSYGGRNFVRVDAYAAPMMRRLHGGAQPQLLTRSDDTMTQTLSAPRARLALLALAALALLLGARPRCNDFLDADESRRGRGADVNDADLRRA